MAGKADAPKSASLADRIKNHLVVVMIGAIAAAIGLGVTGTKLVYDAKLEQERVDHQKEVATLKQSLGNIQRTIGDDTEYLDVGGVLVSQDEASTLGNAQYFSDDRYYALDDSAESDWTASKTDEWQLLVDTVGPKQAAKILDPSIAKQLRTLRVRVWRKDERHRVVVPGREIETLNLSPQVFVERVSAAQMAQSFAKELRQVYEDEPTGLTLVQQLTLQLPAQPRFRAKLVSVQKKENVGYARYESRFTNVRVDGAVVPEYFLTQEIVVVSTSGDIYLIKTTLPRAEPRSDDAAWMTRWFDAFHIVRD